MASITFKKFLNEATYRVSPNVDEHFFKINSQRVGELISNADEGEDPEQYTLENSVVLSKNSVAVYNPQTDSYTITAKSVMGKSGTLDMIITKKELKMLLNM